MPWGSSVARLAQFDDPIRYFCHLGFLKPFNKRVRYEFGSFTRRETNPPEVFASRTSLDYCKQMINFELGSKDARGRTTLFEVNI